MTIIKAHILKELNKINKLFNEPNTTADIEKQRLFSKLALLELCGWIEVTMDQIVENYAKQKIKVAKNFSDFKKFSIDKNYGFEYEKHFRKMLIVLVGTCNVEKIEKNMDQQTKAAFESVLEQLTKDRNPHAHTHVMGTSAQFNSPSITIARFTDIYKGLKEVENQLKKIK